MQAFPSAIEAAPATCCTCPKTLRPRHVHARLYAHSRLMRRPSRARPEVPAPPRRAGVGRALLQALEAWAHARGIQRLQLLYDTSNEPALRFYQHLGWQATRLACLRKRL